MKKIDINDSAADREVLGSDIVAGFAGCGVANACVILMRVSELGCWALIGFVFELISVRRQGGHFTPTKALYTLS